MPAREDASPPNTAAGSAGSAGDAYAAAGVDIDAGNRAVALMRAAVTSTYGPEVLAGIGAFGGLYDARALQSLDGPVLVASTDGVGTKVKLAAAARRYDGIGHDLVNHCINDILVQGARPLFFLDYFAAARLDPEIVAQVVAGLAAACRAAGVALLGGETAEMPGVYAPGEFDLAGTIVGVVERGRVIDGTAIAAGDILVGMASSGAHTNGYTLIRQVFAGVPLAAEFPGVGALGDALLAPHRSYLAAVESLRAAVRVNGLAHITGGGFVDNIPRILPAGLAAEVDLASWPVPALFALIQSRGEIPAAEMYRVFNMGIGLVAVVAADQRDAALAALQTAGVAAWPIGRIVAAGPDHAVARVSLRGERGER
jgi:phosphoribosylformylglycinamidine cyclo-ligase